MTNICGEKHVENWNCNINRPTKLITLSEKKKFLVLNELSFYHVVSKCCLLQKTYKVTYVRENV